MIHNCPNCSAPLNPLQIRCDYCGTYFLDFAAIDFKDRNPCFLRVKTQRGIILVKVYPLNATMEVSYDDTYVTGGRNNTRLARFTNNVNAQLDMSFQCIEYTVPNTDTKALYTLDTRDNDDND